MAHVDREGTPILFHDIFTSGIAYLDLGFNIHTLPDRYLPYVPLFGRALLEMGTDSEDFVTLTQRISRKTGGIAPHPFTSTIKNAPQSTAWLFLRGKAMLHQTEALKFYATKFTPSGWTIKNASARWPWRRRPGSSRN